MPMPNDLFLIRHGESEGNVVTEAAKLGDQSGYTESFMTVPGSQWRLTERGRAQAAAIGAWLDSGAWPHTYWGPGDPPHFDPTFPHFQRYWVSPYVRARETAGELALSGALWRRDRRLRERDWGDIGSIPRPQFRSSPWWAENARMKDSDPLYWCAPNGESVAHVADRVRAFLDDIERQSIESGIVVCHGETIQSFRLELEELSDERYVRIDDDPNEKILNCEALHYTRIDPNPRRAGSRFGGQRQEPRLTWMRRARPVEQADGTWTVAVGDWTEIGLSLETNEEMLAGVGQVPSLHGAATV